MKGDAENELNQRFHRFGTIVALNKLKIVLHNVLLRQVEPTQFDVEWVISRNRENEAFMKMQGNITLLMFLKMLFI